MIFLYEIGFFNTPSVPTLLISNRRARPLHACPAGEYSAIGQYAVGQHREINFLLIDIHKMFS